MIGGCANAGSINGEGERPNRNKNNCGWKGVADDVPPLLYPYTRSPLFSVVRETQGDRGKRCVSRK